jgi:hypothetical protein
VVAVNCNGRRIGCDSPIKQPTRLPQKTNAERDVSI